MLEAFGLSDPGCVRQNNEDYFISDSHNGIFILADGMGGANGGEYASRLSAETLYEYLLHPPEHGAAGALESGFAHANGAVRQASVTNSALEGMGTTLVAARLVAENQLQLANVGDSRVYHWSGNQLSTLTTDQTWVVEVGSRLGISDEALRRHPMRHVLTMAIGVSDALRVDLQVLRISSGDQLLLCSDGLHGVLEEEMLENALKSEKSLPDKAHYLIEAARAKGGPDNITVVLIRVL